MYDLSQVGYEKRSVENLASRLILEKWPSNLNGFKKIKKSGLDF
jgi:hypothetical protein